MLGALGKKGGTNYASLTIRSRIRGKIRTEDFYVTNRFIFHREIRSYGNCLVRFQKSKPFRAFPCSSFFIFPETHLLFCVNTGPNPSLTNFVFFHA